MSRTVGFKRLHLDNVLIFVIVKTTEYVLNKFKGKPPSLILHLHPTHFRFDQQDGSFGYNSPMKIFLEHVRAQTIPHDMLEELFQSGVPFYDGNIINDVIVLKLIFTKAVSYSKCTIIDQARNLSEMSNPARPVR